MPLWSIFHPPGALSDFESRQALVKDITKVYTEAGLPPFYVVANFHELKHEDTFVGAELRTENPFIRFVIKHIAVRQPDDDVAYEGLRKRIDAALKPHIADRGYDYEFHVEETERRLWRINGFDPPPWHSEAEAKWFRENKPTAWQT